MSNSHSPSEQVTLLIFLLFIPFFIKWLLQKKTRKNLPPSPPNLPIIGNLHQLGKNPHRSLQKLSQRYGPIMFLTLGSKPAIVISSSDGAREIMQTHDLIFANRPESKINKKLFYNLRDISTAPYGEYFRQLRTICTQHMLSKKSVSSFRHVREQEIATVVEMINDEYCKFSKPVNLSETFAVMSNTVVGKILFGREYDGKDNAKKLSQHLLDFFGLIALGNIEDFLPWLSWINHVNGKNATADRVVKAFDEFLDGMVDERLGRLERKIANDELNENEDSGEDFVEIMLRIHKDKNSPNPLGREGIKAILLDMLSGGTDTTSTTLDWAMNELVRNPRIMKKLQDEVRGIANGKQHINEDDLQNMHYLKAFIKETLRLYPPVPTILPRTSSESVKVMGYEIPTGSYVIINAWAIARDPSLWDDPEEFKPERFLNSSMDYKGHDFEYIPFGSGRRICPGILFAMVINELALANIINRFDWKLPNGMKKDDVDMTERTGLITHKKKPFFAIPTDPSACE